MTIHFNWLQRQLWWLTPVILGLKTEAGGLLQIQGKPSWLILQSKTLFQKQQNSKGLGNRGNKHYLKFMASLIYIVSSMQQDAVSEHQGGGEF